MSGKRWTSALAHTLALLCLAGLALSVSTGDAGEGFVGIAFLLFMLITLFVGWFLAWRRPRTALGWLTLAIPILFAFGPPLDLLARALLPTHPTAAAWLLVVVGEGSFFWVPWVGLLLSQIPLRFPTGSLPSRRWRWFSWYTVAAIVLATALSSTYPADYDGVANPAYVPWGDAEPILLIGIFGLGLAVSFVGAVASLFVRYRRAGTLQRAQLRWVFWAGALAAGLLIVVWVSLLFPADGLFGWLIASLQGSAGYVLIFLGYGLIPVAILIAVMRFGLYGIDRIISRTVSYTTVVIVVVALYAGVVVGLTALIPNLPSIGVALATLAAAAVFLPLLRVVRRGVDRRFNRAAYDAQQVVEAFGQRLRTGADPHTAAADLATAVEKTLQPSTLGVWTR